MCKMPRKVTTLNSWKGSTLHSSAKRHRMPCPFTHCKSCFQQVDQNYSALHQGQHPLSADYQNNGTLIWGEEETFFADGVGGYHSTTVGNTFLWTGPAIYTAANFTAQNLMPGWRSGLYQAAQDINVTLIEMLTEVTDGDVPASFVNNITIDSNPVKTEAACPRPPQWDKRGHRCNWKSKAVHEACVRGNAAVLDWWDDYGEKISSVHLEVRYYIQYPVDLAAKYGHVNILSWIKSKRQEFHGAKNVIEVASYHGHTIVLDWWIHESSERNYSKASIDNASQNGTVNVLDWLKDNEFT
ncbi:hypothetical protein BJ742DRAFT_870447 [Cladochytrium replicatum]|nr:hypothetical protein BJ742DRAFT_870447 [Cladochytrium replicatum]